MGLSQGFTLGVLLEGMVSKVWFLNPGKNEVKEVTFPSLKKEACG